MRSTSNMVLPSGAAAAHREVLAQLAADAGQRAGQDTRDGRGASPHFRAAGL
jgi:hypothetical protein